MTSIPGLDDAGIAAVAKRVDVLEQLRDGPMAVRDVVDEMDHSRSTINRALSELESHGLIEQTDGGYVTSLTGSMVASEHRKYLERMSDLLGTDTVLAPLPPTSSVGRQIAVGARTETVAESNPVGTLELVYEALSAGEHLQILLPSLPSKEFLERLETALLDRQVEAQIVIGPALLESFDGRLARSVEGFARMPQCELRTGPMPSYGLVVSSQADSSLLALLVFDAGKIHGVLSNDREEAVAWGIARFEDCWEAAEPLTDAQVNQLDSRAGTDSLAANREARTRTDDGFPFELRADGWTQVDDSLFENRTPVEPAVGWRTGLGFTEIRAGYAVDRERSTDDGRRSLRESLVDDLAEGSDVAVIGPPGSGKSTLCKSVAYEWFEADRGSVFYRESGSGAPFDATVLLEERLREAADHALVVVEDVMRAEASAVLEVAESLRDHPNVSFLFDSRETEWTDVESQPLDARVEAYRSREVETVPLPPLDERERDRFVERFERLADVSFDGAAFDFESPELDADERGSVGEVLLLSHRLSSLADPTLSTESVPSSLDEEIRRVVASLQEATADVALDVAILANVLNGSGVGVYPELLFALVDVAPATDVRDAVRTLEGQLLFAGSESRAPTDRYRSVHGFWSSLFLRHVADRLPDREAQERIGRCVTALLSLAEREELRERIAREFEGSTPYLDSVVEGPTEWVDRTVEQVFAFGRNNPGLAQLYGKTGYSNIDLPELTSPETRFRVIELRGEMARTAGMLDRAEDEFSLLVDPDEQEVSTAPDERPRMEAKGLKKLSDLKRGRGNFERAKAMASEGLERYESLDDQRGVAGCLNALGAAAFHLSDYQDALEHYTRSLEIRREIGDTTGVASTLMNLGATKMLLAEFDVAERYYEESLAIRRDIGDRWGVAVTLDTIGLLHHARGRFVEAEQSFRSALNVARDIGATKQRMLSSAHLCEVLILQGTFDEAEQYIESSVQIADDIDESQFRSYLYTMRAKLALYRGDYEETVSLAERGREQANDIGYKSFEAYATERLSIAYRNAGELDAAAELAAQNVATRRDLEERDNVAESLVTLAEVRIDQREYDAAADLLAEALDIARETGASFFEARAQRALGELAAAEGRPDDAREHLEDAIETFRDGGALPDAAVAVETLVAACETQGDVAAVDRWRATRDNLLAETDLDEAWLRHRTASPEAD